MIAGEHQPPAVHALAHAMNATLGNVGKTVFYTDPIEANPVDQLASLQDLVKDLDAGAVDLLLILGGNPVFNAPVELGLRDRIQKARVRAHLSLYDDETSRALPVAACPKTHYLEAWGDARAFDGTVTIQQPLIQPLYGGKSAYEVLQMLTESPNRNGLRDRQGLLGRPAHRRRISKPGGGARCTMAWWPARALPAKTPAINGAAITRAPSRTPSWAASWK